MPVPKDEFVKNPLFAGLIIAAVVAYLIIFHFLLGMTWMIYVLVLAVVVLILIRKLKVMKAQKAQLSGKSP
ncbi:MAG: hypothetical protein GYA24_18185 [Candidatus Lokiarchaeota archaeon]|nr:hypothetical protein [Candidatus Lokiarchaeota archaeon]